MLATSLFGAKPTLLFYCGITMVKPMKEISNIIEKKYNCKIEILQGASKDLYDSLKYNKIGDLYLPGSETYRNKNIKDGLLLDYAEIGYNQASIFVAKGNPKHISGLKDLTNEDLRVFLCDPQSGSVGKMTKRILSKYKNEDFFDLAYDNTSEIVVDSSGINTAFVERRADIAINWKATAYEKENKNNIDIIEIDKKYAPRKKLLINLLKFSKYPKIAKGFIEYAQSKDGQKIMHKYGFRD